MLNHLGFFFFFAFFLLFFSKVRVGAKEGGSHYWEMAVAITCGYGGYLLPLLAAYSSWYWIFKERVYIILSKKIVYCLNCSSLTVLILFSFTNPLVSFNPSDMDNDFIHYHGCRCPGSLGKSSEGIDCFLDDWLQTTPWLLIYRWVSARKT